jgi:hypothetical protein
VLFPSLSCYLTQLFNAVLPNGLKTSTPIFDPENWEGSGAALIYLLDMIGKLFEKILLSRIVYEVTERELLHNEQFRFRPKHSTALQLARL